MVYILTQRSEPSSSELEVCRVQVPAPQLPCQGSLSLHTQLLLLLVGVKNEALLNPDCLESDPPASALQMQG